MNWLNEQELTFLSSRIHMRPLQYYVAMINRRFPCVRVCRFATKFISCVDDETCRSQMDEERTKVFFFLEDKAQCRRVRGGTSGA
jgi:hypothetical protein